MRYPKKAKRGYCSLCADILHEGHIKYIHKCKSKCDYLIVGVMTDEAIISYKHAKPVMEYKERAYIVENIKGVDEVVPQLYFDVAGRNSVDIYFDSKEHGRWGAVLFDRCSEQSSSKIKEKIRFMK